MPFERLEHSDSPDIAITGGLGANRTNGAAKL